MGLGAFTLDLCILLSDVCLGGACASVILKLLKSKSAAGMSLQTLFTVAAARCVHTVSHTLRLHYSPDHLPSSLYVCTDLLNACVAVACLVFFLGFHMPTYEREKDIFGLQVFQRLNFFPKGSMWKDSPLVAASFLYFVIAVLAFLWNLVRRGVRSFAINYFCCFYEVACAVALIPQLWMFQQDKRVSPLLGNFVVWTALSRMTLLLFWVLFPWVYPLRIPENRGIQMASEILNLLILSDFLYYWARAKLRGDNDIVIGERDLV